MKPLYMLQRGLTEQTVMENIVWTFVLKPLKGKTLGYKVWKNADMAEDFFWILHVKAYILIIIVMLDWDMNYCPAKKLW